MSLGREFTVSLSWKRSSSSSTCTATENTSTASLLRWPWCRRASCCPGPGLARDHSFHFTVNRLLERVFAFAFRFAGHLRLFIHVARLWMKTRINWNDRHVFFSFVRTTLPSLEKAGELLTRRAPPLAEGVLLRAMMNSSAIRFCLANLIRYDRFGMIASLPWITTTTTREKQTRWITERWCCVQPIKSPVNHWRVLLNAIHTSCDFWLPQLTMESLSI